MLETIVWIPIEEGQPDAETTVLIALDDTHSEPSGSGYFDGATWRDEAGQAITGVLGWDDMPAGMRP